VVATVFFSYSHKDEELRDRLETHLATLKRQGQIDTWHDRRILGGDEFDGHISEHLEQADIILLLVSPDFLASNYCCDREMLRAMERHHAGQARVIPIILRHCDWHSTPLGKLQAAPRDGKPVQSWPDYDEALLDVVLTIRAALRAGNKSTQAIPLKRPATSTTQSEAINQPRSSNLSLRRNFTDADRDTFFDNAFEYMARFFENSLDELKARNPGIKTSFKRVDANRFTAVAYSNGQAKAGCKVVLGGMFGKGITFSQNDRLEDSSVNESLTLKDDGQMLYLSPIGMATYGKTASAHMTFEGASEYYWDVFIRPLRP
jgi:hypothetical protein